MAKMLPPRIKSRGTTKEAGTGMDSEAEMGIVEEMGIVGDRIKELRNAKGWTQAQLATEAGITQGVIGKIEAGHSKRTNKLAEIAHALGVEAGDIDPKFKPRKPSKVSVAEDRLALRSVDDWDRFIGYAFDEAFKLAGKTPSEAAEIAGVMQAIISRPWRVPPGQTDSDVLRRIIRGELGDLLRPARKL